MARILIATFTFWPNLDGVARASLTTARTLAALGHDVTVATGAPESPTSVGESFRVVRFDVQGIRGGELPIEGTGISAYVRFVLNGTWDVMICEGWAVWPTALAEDVFGVMSARKVLVSHGAPGPMWVPKWKPFWGLGPVWRSLRTIRSLPQRFHLYDRMVFLGRNGQWSAYADAQEAFRRVPDKCRIIPNEIDPHEFVPDSGGFRQQHGIGQDFLVVTVANFSSTKNQRRTVEVFARAGLNNAVLCLIGSSRNEYVQGIAEQWDRKTGRQRRSGIRVMAGLPRREVCAAIRDADACLLTSRKETQSIFLLESMAAGVPFVSTPAGCAAEWPGGLTVRSSRSLVHALRSIAENRDLRRKLGDAGRCFVAGTHGPDAIRRQWKHLIDELCGGDAKAAGAGMNGV